MAHRLHHKFARIQARSWVSEQRRQQLQPPQLQFRQQQLPGLRAQLLVNAFAHRKTLIDIANSGQCFKKEILSKENIQDIIHDNLIRFDTKQIFFNKT